MTETFPPGNKLRPVSDVRDLIHADALGTWDTFAPCNTLTIKDGALAFLNERGDEARLTPTPWATGQLCARLGIPASYFRKCPTILQDVQAMYWLRESAARGINLESRWLLRAKGETLRAVLSERYSPLDHTELVEVLAPFTKAHHQVDWLDLSDEGLHLRIVDPHRTRDVLPGDGLSVGIHISNSEVGSRSISIDALVYRLVCTNGLIRLVKGKSLLKQRHVHIGRPRLVAAIEEAVSQAWSEAEGFLEQMKRTTQMPVQDVEGTLERLGEKWHLSKAVQDDLLSSLLREPVQIQETVYGVVNAVTNVAQRLSSDARYDMEVLAGHLAEHGVASYAPKPRPRSHAPFDHTPFTHSDFSESESFDVVEAAREMFEAEIVSRHTHLAPFSREVVKS